MNRTLGVVALTLSLMAAACLNKSLNPGRCNSTSDCLAGQTCDLSPSANGTCVCASASCMDGGTAGASGDGATDADGSGAGKDGSATEVDAEAGAAGDGGQDLTPTCQPSCAAPRSICSPNLMCVECLTSADCTTATKPICDTAGGVCAACSSDDQCKAKLGPNPGVCMAHEDGRCATDAETVYVQNDTSICVDAIVAGDSSSGTAAKPFCSMQPVPIRLTSTRTVVVVRGTVPAGNWNYGGQVDRLSVIGQGTALIASATTAAFGLQSGPVYIRGVKFSSSASIGIRATGGTLTLDTVTVDSCMGGGIFLDGAAFDIENTTVTNNGVGQQGAVSWGGILVNSLASSGPKKLHLLTVENNKLVGLACAATVTGDGVFASGNVGGVDVQTSCGITPCTPKSPTCGAQ